MKRSGFKMKGYSYAGKSPLRQSKFKKEGEEGKLDKLIKKIVTPKKEEEVDNSFISPSDDTKVDKDQFIPEISISSTKRRSMEDTKANETYYGDSYANRIKSGLTYAGMSKRDLKKMRTKKVAGEDNKQNNNKKKKKELNKDRRSVWDNEILSDLAVGTTLSLIGKKKEQFVPVNIAGKQHKIM